ncbi:DNA polymerase III subunit beta [Nocardiopsis sp. RSe5-2]|uniref:Beta sliding clamp n=1 Tax=Nocardiopsis endophytica TaxID=3018445 RepID=A0ABT4U9Q3_9ACTN|nr:DNA polymerase III subunit beta [Nocardiopsis endophytica]MDA2813668.1 DNA polymerase III subunit beta [Nocardiopsis endophytica]
MRIRADRDAFAEAVAWTARALPLRPAMPVLAGMRMEAADGVLRLSGFDYEVSARARVDAEVEEAGAVLVSGRLLAEIARSLPAYPVGIEADGGRVLLTCGPARFTLVTLPLEDHPLLPDMPPAAGSLPGEAFAGAVRQVVPAASRDDTLPMLTGVHLDFGADSLALAATDRYRIAVRRMWWRPEHPGAAGAALVPARTLSDLARTLDPSSNVEVFLSGAAGGGASASGGEGMIGFESGGRSSTTRLIDSDYIPYEKRFPTEAAARAEVPPAAFTEAVKRVALVADRSTPVRITFTPGSGGSAGEAVLEAGSGEDAQAAEAMAVDYDGEPMRIAFAPGYLLDGLAGVSTERARLDMTQPTKPAVISDAPAAEGEEPEFRYLVMPLRLS